MSVANIRDYVHHPLREAQEFLPIIGVVPAVLHIAVGLIQAVVGIIIALLSAIIAIGTYCMGHRKTGVQLAEYTFEGVGHVVDGSVATTKSVINILTLGIFYSI